ncbi:MAG: MotA/TolQ/ExbB proton channel family protein [candidate division WOR-3 bacterium]
MKILNLDIIVRGFETASPFAKLILIILFFLSVLSWAIFIKKFFEFLLIKKRTRSFIEKFNEIPFEDLIKKNPFDLKKKILPSSVLKIVVNEIEKIKENPAKIELSSILFENIEKIYKKEIEKLEKYIPVLATITSVSPFLGLLGTVWGIMEAFLEIKRTGSAHISVLAPGIADALITTIAGLLVAIPSLIFHNYFINETNKYDSLCEEFLKDVKIKIKKYLIL